MIEALAEAGRRDPELAAAVHVHSFGPLNAEDRSRAEAHGLSDRFHAEEAVPLEEALSALRRFDILLLSTHPERDEIIPAKLLEYLAVGRPILSLSPNPEVARILEETGTGVQLPVDDAAGLAGLLLRCAGARRQGRPLPIPFARRRERGGGVRGPGHDPPARRSAGLHRPMTGAPERRLSHQVGGGGGGAHRQHPRGHLHGGGHRALLLSKTDFAVLSYLLILYQVLRYLAMMGFPDSVFYFFERLSTVRPPRLLPADLRHPLRRRRRRRRPPPPLRPRSPPRGQRRVDGAQHPRRCSASCPGSPSWRSWRSPRGRR